MGDSTAQPMLWVSPWTGGSVKAARPCRDSLAWFHRNQRVLFAIAPNQDIAIKDHDILGIGDFHDLRGTLLDTPDVLYAHIRDPDVIEL